MPISLISELIPKNSALFALLDDQFIRGGFHCVANLTERNSISTDRRKHGMKVFVQSTDIVYILQSDMISWIPDIATTSTLQAAYNSGNEIQVIDSKPVVIKNASTEILRISADNSLEFNQTLKGKDYTSSINASIIANATVVVDTTDRSKYRAIQYCYTVTNSDQSGFETGHIYLIHDGISAIINSSMDVSQNVPCGITFNVELSGYNLRLIATTDNFGVFSRIVHLFKVALV